MNKPIVLALIMATGVLGNTTNIHSAVADKKPASTEERSPTKARALPFRGKLDALDKEGKTLTVGKRTFHLTDHTRITRASKPASVADAVLGEEIAGSYRKTATGSLELNSLRLGPKATKPSGPAPTPAPEKKE